ncbi:uncharacterized protein BX664DRAFT_150519 [Halteromyces radiatus]|uniref:uncharacterized protein n=1 Tax=Halteromyces radiatus TaxID=101107 RepID=UPI0022207EAC|nr:uncharacterized protein BX664DRAFT_150519 [Halteromyces radiatus]KAI8086097.1 hypothetical protein BX664DRAFT_150519 [Halteromyces radiatus]
MKQLAKDYRLILLTFKNSSCPVCPQLLHILNLYGVDPHSTTYQDPFTLEEWEIDEATKKFFRILLRQDAYFVILCPGPSNEVAHIQNKTNFPYPFIAGDQALSLGKALKMNMSDRDLWPAIFEVTMDTLDVHSIYVGRSPGHYYHQTLLKMLVRGRGKCEMKGIASMRDAYDTIDRLKRKSIKCEKQSLATWILTLPTSRTAKSPQLPESTLSSPLPSPLPNVCSPIGSTTGTVTILTSQQDQHISDDVTTPTTDTKDTPVQQLPPEILELALSFIPDTRSLVGVARVSRLYYVTVCNIVGKRLRIKMDQLALALPQDENGNKLVDETDVFSKYVDRWGDDDQAIGYRELERRVAELRHLIDDIGKWTRCWSPRRKAMNDNRTMTPILSTTPLMSRLPFQAPFDDNFGSLA